MQFFLCVSLLFILPKPVLAKEVNKFSDVPNTFWAYNAISSLTEKGLLHGTTTSTGSVVYAPFESMTRAQLISILTRYLYNDELSTMKAVSGQPWYANNYEVAVKHGLLDATEYELSDMVQLCSRQELAYLLMNAVVLETKEEPKDLVPISSISDFASIDPIYRKSVRQAYSLGLLSGIDSSGTFSPQGVLNRAQVASVLYRLYEPSARVPVTLEEVSDFTWPDGTTYHGVILNGEANGYGQMVHPNIGSFTGYFVNGKREGIGTFQWLVGDQYVGNWKNDMMSGEGVYTFADGFSIRGPWEDNKVLIQNFTLSASSKTMFIGNSDYIVAKFLPTNATEEIFWSSSDTSILTISGEDNLGTIVAKAGGTARVTATTETGLMSSCVVTVKAKPTPAKQILLNYGDYTLKINEQFTLRTIINSNNAFDVKVNYRSNNSSIASITADGVVTAHSSGTTIISGTTESGLVATCYVTVIDPFTELWSGSWDIYDSDSAGKKKYSSLPAIGTSQFNIGNMSVNLSNYPFNGSLISVSKLNNYTLTGVYKTSSYAYELAFTSINNTQIVLEVKSILSSAYLNDYVTTSYYVLYKR